MLSGGECVILSAIIVNNKRFDEDTGMKEIIKDAIAVHRRLVDEFEAGCVEDVAAAAETIIACFKAGGTVYICGNGGSAADAQHIAGELIGRLKVNRRSLPAVALSTDTSVLTCVGNDYGFDEIFARQVEGLTRKGDVLWAFSTSGTSSNVLKAVKVAKDKGAKIIAFTGRKNTPLESASDVCVAVDAEWSCESQEMHQLAYHVICDLVEREFCQ